MIFDVVRQLIVDNGIVPKATNKKDKRRKYDAVFLIEKPEELEADTFLIYRYQLDEGGIIKKYRFEIDIFAKNVLDGEKLKNDLINLLDYSYQPCEIEEFIKFSLFSVDSFSYDETTEYYRNTLYFRCNSFE